METVRFFDLDTGRIVNIPASELAPGAVQAQVQGIEGTVWLLADKLIAGKVRHPPFRESIRDVIRSIQAAFAEQRPLSLEEWEEGFRRDANPGPEIALWLHAANVFSSFADGEPDAARRREMFRCIGTCMNAGPETIWRVFQVQLLSRHEAEAIIERFYAGPVESDAESEDESP